MRYERFPGLREEQSARTSKMNSDPIVKRNQYRGKIGKMINKLISEGLEFNEQNWKSFTYEHFRHGGIKYKNILKYFNSSHVIHSS